MISNSTPGVGAVGDDLAADVFFLGGGDFGGEARSEEAARALKVADELDGALALAGDAEADGDFAGDGDLRLDGGDLDAGGEDGF